MAVTAQRAVRAVRGVQAAGETLAFRRAAEELGLKVSELELAVQMEEVRTVSAAPRVRRRVPREEVTRLRAAEGFPRALRERLRTVGTAGGAELLGVGPARFARLARSGCFSPVKFYVNRYRAVVWLYAAVELRRFAEQEPALLAGSTPLPLRAALDAGEDRRARNWRSRRVGQLVRQADDPWERAAVLAAVLGADQVAQAVRDPDERTYLRGLRPALVTPGADASAATRKVVAGLLTADGPEEIRRYRRKLCLALDEARAVRSAPRRPGAPVRPVPSDDGPEPVEHPVPDPRPPGDTAPEPAPRGARKWLWRRG